MLHWIWNDVWILCQKHYRKLLLSVARKSISQCKHKNWDCSSRDKSVLNVFSMWILNLLACTLHISLLYNLHPKFSHQSHAEWIYYNKFNQLYCFTVKWIKLLFSKESYSFPFYSISSHFHIFIWLNEYAHCEAAICIKPWIRFVSGL